jgi:hypothetical protein
MAEQYYTKTITFRLQICSSLMKNADPTDGPHRGIDCKFEYFSEIEFIFETALGYESGGWGTCFDEKKTRT